MAAGNEGSPGDLPTRILHALAASDPVLTADVFPEVPFAELKAALDSLSSKSMITYKALDQEVATLEPEGEQIAAHGSHEARVFEALRAAMEGLTIPELEKTIGDKGVTKVGQGKAFKEKWISKTSDGKLVATVCLLASPFVSHLQKNRAG